MDRPDLILIAGPTASGKSKHALELADQFDGEIINADSMQIYPVLNVLTARPDVADMAKHPHHLYGFADIDAPYSVALWLEQATSVAQEIMSRGKVPVFVGGTGLYFRALENGLANTPVIPDDIRSEIRKRLIGEGASALHEDLQRSDPEAAGRLLPTDGQRIARALEVITATGRSLSSFQQEAGADAFTKNLNADRLLLMPTRAILHESINARTKWMLENGAVEEVQALLAQDPAPQSTAMKAIGVPQISDYLSGKYSFERACELIQAATRQYAKRQTTWFRGQMGENWRVFDDYL